MKFLKSVIILSFLTLLYCNEKKKILITGSETMRSMMYMLVKDFKKIYPDIEAKVKAIVAEQLGVDQAEISRETSFVNDLNADSLDTVELVMEFEDEFDMSIPDEEAEKIQTVGAAIDYIIEIVKNKSQE